MQWFDGGSCWDALRHCQVIINRTEWSGTRELSILFDRMEASFFRLAFGTASSSRRAEIGKFLSAKYFHTLNGSKIASKLKSFRWVFCGHVANVSPNNQYECKFDLGLVTTSCLRQFFAWWLFFFLPLESRPLARAFASLTASLSAKYEYEIIPHSFLDTGRHAVPGQL